MERALATMAIKRLREHVEEADRMDRGIPTAQVLRTALNRDLHERALSRTRPGSPGPAVLSCCGGARKAFVPPCDRWLHAGS